MCDVTSTRSFDIISALIMKKANIAAVLFLFLFFPIGLYLMWAKTSWNKKVKWGITGVYGFFFFISLIVNLSSSKSSKDASVLSKTASAQNSLIQSATNTPEPTATPKPTTMNDKLWAVFNKNYDERYKKGTNIQYSDIDKTAKVIVEPGKYWSDVNLYDLDEKRLVEEAISTVVVFGREAFKVDGVERVGVDYRMPFTDSYGKKTLTTAFSFSMNKSEFNKYHWDNLKGKPIYAQIIRSTQEDPLFYIEPALLSKINPDEIILRL